MDTYLRYVEESCQFLVSTLPSMPKTLIQLGTGLGDIAKKLENPQVTPFREIPHFPRSSVESHHGNLITGELAGHSVAMLQGRVHYYEGFSAREVAFPIRVLSLLGAKTLIVTNSSGGLNPLFSPGTIMVMRDHLNFLGDNPLRGPNVDAWGPRFPDLSEPYDKALIKYALDAATSCKIPQVVSGVYACVPGPSLETPAETRWLKEAGADAVGMSSVPEVIVARHGGMRVLGLSAISNVNDPDNFQPILLQDILDTSALIGPRMEQLIIQILTTISGELS